MTFEVLKAGVQTTIQSTPRVGFRHLGVPAGGPADPLSLALANRLVGNKLLAAGLEATLTGPTLRFESSTAFALCGGNAAATLNGANIEFHRTTFAKAGDELVIGSIEVGMRVYMAFAGGLLADEVLGSSSTYLPAGFGGLEGRGLEEGDILIAQAPTSKAGELTTPEKFRPPVTTHWAVRVCRSAETHLLVEGQRSVLLESRWVIGRRADRMGLQLEGANLDIASGGRLSSAPVFPGTIQCPEDGTPFLLTVDAQTVGGYSRVAQIARADRHLLGQMRPGDRLQFLPRQPKDAIRELRAKHDYWREWLPGIEQVI